MKILELNHIALHVADLERSVAFYREVLRLVPIPRPAFDFPGAWFQLGAVQELHLIGGRGGGNPLPNPERHRDPLVDRRDAPGAGCLAAGGR